MPAMQRPLRTEADLVRALGPGAYTLAELYREAERRGLADRPGGRDDAGDGQPKWKRRMRSAVYAERRRGRARAAEGVDQATWIIEGSREEPRRAVFVWLPSDPSRLEIVLGKAHEVLARCDEPIDLIVADPPYGLDRGGKDAAYQRTYRRNHAQVVDGYVEWDQAEYDDLTAEWITAAGVALRPGGYLAVITGPQQQATVQKAAEGAGLTYVNKIAVRRPFGQYCTRRFVHAHQEITLMTRGALDSRRRVFFPPEEMPRGPQGCVNAEDIWTDIPKYERPGRLRYDNQLHPKLISRVVRSCTRRGDLVGDPFLGGGTTFDVCVTEHRRFYGGDANPESLRFTMGRVLTELVPEIRAVRGRPAPAETTQLQLALADLW